MNLLSLFFMAIKMVSLPYWVHHVLNLFGIVFIIAVVTLYAFTLSKPLHGYLNNNNWRFGAGLGRLAGKLLEALAIINNFKTILILGGEYYGGGLNQYRPYIHVLVIMLFAYTSVKFSKEKIVYFFFYFF